MKWIGNLVPLPFFVIPVVYGYRLLTAGFRPDPSGYTWIGIGFAAGWLAVALLGGLPNPWLRCRLMAREAIQPVRGQWFVGCSPTGFKNALDPHQDIGILSLGFDEMTYVGDQSRWTMSRSEIKSIRFRPNVHTMLLLGGWLEIERQDGTALARVRVEPRSGIWVVSSLWLLPKLRRRIADWWLGPSSSRNRVS